MDLTPTTAPLTTGQVLEGKYRVGKPLGAGSMGLVYEAEHVLLQKPVALKVLRPEFAAQSDVRERFESEARAAAAIGHPNIISVSDMGRTPEGAIYYVMDRLRGESLADRLRSAGRMSAATAVPIVIEILGGLEAAHALGLIHRDLKPENVFLAQDASGREVPRILDFGIAKALSIVAKRSTGTRAGIAVGTPLFMSPEQAIASADIDARADLYSVGVLLYTLLAGRPPFSAVAIIDVLEAVVKGLGEPLERFCPEAPPALVRIIEMAMSRDRTLRPASARDFADRLRALKSLEPFSAPGLKSTAPTLFELDDAPSPPAPAAMPPMKVELARPMPRRTASLPVPKPSSGLLAGRTIRNAVFGVTLFLALGRGGLWVWEKLPKTTAPAIQAATREAPVVKAGEPVVMAFDVYPLEARISVDGKTLTNPAQFPRGSTQRLVVTAEGFTTKEIDLTIDYPRTVEITLVKRK